MNDEELKRWFTEEHGYLCVHKLPTGEWAGLAPFIFTTGLCVGLDRSGYRTRFCYKNTRDALAAIVTWDGTGDPPGPWIKEKGPVERTNPNFKDIPIRVEQT
jgi:hypothetical protein